MILILVSTGHFDPLIEACDRIRDRFDFFGQIGMGYYEPHFPFLRTASPEQIEELIQKADMVISHGGTGMLSQLYRYRKPTVIVPKQKRYGEANDSQVELAEKWAQLQMGILCKDVTEIEKSILACKTQQFEFPVFPKVGEFLNVKLGLTS